MVQIISSWVYKGITGYEVEEEGVIYSVTERCLYEPDLLMNLIEAGYKVRNYNGDITHPSGVPIKELVQVEYTGTEDEWQTLLDLGDSALTECEAAEYFTREIEVDAKEFKEPKVVISTRAELCKYLETVTSGMRKGEYDRRIAPLNSFVAKEALFTLDELVIDEEVQKYMRMIAQQRRLYSREEYNKLIMFLQSEGVLSKEFTAEDVKDAYLSWGLDGVKTDAVSIGKVVNVATGTEESNATTTRSSKGKEMVWGIVDKEGNLYYKDVKCNCREFEDFSNAVLAPTEESDYLRDYSLGESEYKPIRLLYSESRERTILRFMNEEGLKYKANVDMSEMAIFEGDKLMWHDTFLDVMPGEISLSLEEVMSEEDYVFNIYAEAKARELVQNNTKEVPCKGSFELALQEGVTPEAALRWVVLDIAEHPARCAKNYNPNMDIRNTHMSLHVELIESEMEAAIGPNWRELTRIELGEELAASQAKRAEAGLKGSEFHRKTGTAFPMPIPIVEQLQLVKSIIEDNMSVMDMFEGGRIDGEVEYKRVSQILKTVVQVRLGTEAPLSLRENMLTNIESENAIRVEDIVRYREEKYKGYLKDKTRLNDARIAETEDLINVYQVFREVTNECDEAKQRHYAFNCQVIETQRGTTGRLCLDKVIALLRESINEMQVEVTAKSQILAEVSRIGATLMFDLVVEARKKGHDFVKRVKLGSSEIEILVTNDMQRDLASIAVMRKYTTLNDYCKYEVGSLGYFLHYCVNADITPWRVKPKGLTRLRSYNTAVQMYSTSQLIGIYGESAARRVCAEGYVVSNFIETEEGKRVEAEEWRMYVDGVGDKDTVEQLLSRDVRESAKQYVGRFQCLQNVATEKGTCLKTMRLKADVEFEEFAEVCGEERMVNEKYVEYGECDAMYYMNAVSTREIGKDVNMAGITEKENKITELRVQDIVYEDVIRWGSLISGEFKPSKWILQNSPKVVSIYNLDNGKAVLVGKIDLRMMTEEQAEECVREGVFYKGAPRIYILKQSGKYLKVEVR